MLLWLVSLSLAVPNIFSQSVMVLRMRSFFIWISLSQWFTHSAHIALDTCFVSTSAACSSLRTSYTFRMSCGFCCTHIVCTSRCLHLRPGPSLCENVCTLERSVQLSGFYTSRVSPAIKFFAYIPFTQTFVIAVASASAQLNETVSSVKRQCFDRYCPIFSNPRSTRHLDLSTFPKLSGEKNYHCWLTLRVLFHCCVWVSNMNIVSGMDSVDQISHDECFTCLANISSRCCSSLDCQTTNLDPIHLVRSCMSYALCLLGNSSTFSNPSNYIIMWGSLSPSFLQFWLWTFPRPYQCIVRQVSARCFAHSVSVAMIVWLRYLHNPCVCQLLVSYALVSMVTLMSWFIEIVLSLISYFSWLICVKRFFSIHHFLLDLFSADFIESSSELVSWTTLYPTMLLKNVLCEVCGSWSCCWPSISRSQCVGFLIHAAK